MPLVPSVLEEALLDRWLEPGTHPSSASESGQRFAQAVAGWFATAMAGPFPCSTASARESGLASQAGSALSAGVSAAAGAQLAQAVATYYTGQSFGTGVAASPIGTPAAVVALGAVFADLEAPVEARAERIALVCHALALTTIVTFPPAPPMPPSPVFFWAAFAAPCVLEAVGLLARSGQVF